MSTDIEYRNRVFGAGNSYPVANNHLRALVVDDEQIMISISSAMLLTIGFKVDTATNGREAFSLLEVHDYDLVLTDLIMPEMDGYKLATVVKKKNEDTVVFIMTGSSRRLVRDMMRTKFVDRWLFKPFSFHLLTKTLQRHFYA